MIRAIIFDFGRTLAASADGFRTAEKELQKKAFVKSFGPSLTFEEGHTILLSNNAH